MARECCITGKRCLFGNSISHSKVSTGKKFNVNLRNHNIYVPQHGVFIKLKISSAGLRNIAKSGHKTMKLFKKLYLYAKKK